MQLVWFGPLLIPTAHISPRANPTKWDQLLSLGEARLHQDVHCWNHVHIWVFIFSEHMRFAGCFPHKQEVKLRARPCALAMHPEPKRSALQSWTTGDRMKLFKTKLFCGKPPSASLCPLLQWDAGRLHRQAGSLSSRRHSYVWGHGATKLSQAWHQATFQWQNTAVILLLPSAFSPNTYFAFAEVLLFSFSALRFSTTHEHMVQFYPITLHPWLVCF